MEERLNMKRLKLVTVLVAALMAPVTPSFAQAAPAAGPQVLRDGDGAKSVRFENMHQTRFIELFFGTKDPKTGKLVAPCFNTMYTSKKPPRPKTPLHKRWSKASTWRSWRKKTASPK